MKDENLQETYLKRFPIWISYSKYHSWKFTLPGKFNLLLVLQKIGNRINGKEYYFLIIRLTKRICSNCFRTGLLRDSMQQSLKTNEVPEQGKVNYTIENQMLEFFRANHIIARGHNIFLGRPQYNPGWVSYRSSTKISSRLTDSKLNEHI